MEINWKVTVDEHGEYWDCSLGEYSFRIAVPNQKIFKDKSLCMLYINRRDKDINYIHCLEERSLDSFLEANQIAEKVYEIVYNSKAHMVWRNDEVRRIADEEKD